MRWKRLSAGKERAVAVSQRLALPDRSRARRPGWILGPIGLFVATIALSRPATCIAQETPRDLIQAESTLEAQLDALITLEGPIVVVREGPKGTQTNRRLRPPDRALDHVSQDLRARLEGRPGLEVVSAEAGEAALATLTFTAADLQAEARRNAFLRYLHANSLILVRGVSEGADLTLGLDLYVVGAPTPKSTEVKIAKTDELSVYLGEPLPGTLDLRLPGSATAFLDQGRLGDGSRGAIRRRVAAGEHELRVELEGYPDYGRNISIPSSGTVHIRVHERSNAGVPGKSLLASSLVPGLGLLLYGRPRSTLPGTLTPELTASAGAIIFYTGAVMYGIDATQGEKFLTPDSRDRHEMIKRYELAGAAVGYVINLVGAFAVGSEFARRNRQLISATAGHEDRLLTLQPPPETGPTVRVAWQYKF